MIVYHGSIRKFNHFEKHTVVQKLANNIDTSGTWCTSDIYIDEPNLKDFDSYDLFMKKRDKYCNYAGTKKETLPWKDKAILLNKDEASFSYKSYEFLEDQYCL